ncbi:hypothetical protein [Leucobacter massiliensis]|uniref:hypothetical protein n=1 Tax=Leucobacter massiliensis TaxID=1686285 RepID=UPI0011B28ECE|nr:hypothetical protein [Leucobacter massiliensis]
MTRVDHWPEAVRSAELMRGTLLRCGPGVRLAAWPETPRVRAAALAPWLTPDRIAIRMVAAWVWGAARDPGRPLEFSTAGRRRPSAQRRSELVLRQYHYPEGTVVPLDGLLVTVPEQTVYDLLRSPGDFGDRQRLACRLLAQLVSGGRAGLAARLEQQHAQFRALARRRLAEL